MSEPSREAILLARAKSRGADLPRRKGSHFPKSSIHGKPGPNPIKVEPVVEKAKVAPPEPKKPRVARMIDDDDLVDLKVLTMGRVYEGGWRY